MKKKTTNRVKFHSVLVAILLLDFFFFFKFGNPRAVPLLSRTELL